jgi:hypothetical protein
MRWIWPNGTLTCEEGKAAFYKASERAPSAQGAVRVRSNDQTLR